MNMAFTVERKGHPENTLISDVRSDKIAVYRFSVSLLVLEISAFNWLNTQFCRIKGCGGAGCPPPPPPPPIIFERLKLPQQIIYRRKDCVDSPNHLKYRENILISRFYEHFSRNGQNLGHFWKLEKISNS